MRELVDRDRTRPCGEGSRRRRSGKDRCRCILRNRPPCCIQAGTAPAPDQPRPAKSRSGTLLPSAKALFRSPSGARADIVRPSERNGSKTIQRGVYPSLIRNACEVHATSPQATSSSIDRFRGHAEPSALQIAAAARIRTVLACPGPQSSRFQYRAMPLSLTPFHRRAGPIGWKGFRLPLGDMQAHGGPCPVRLPPLVTAFPRAGQADPFIFAWRHRFIGEIIVRLHRRVGPAPCPQRSRGSAPVIVIEASPARSPTAPSLV